jgi:DNA-binding NtrC family response regulator
MTRSVVLVQSMDSTQDLVSMLAEHHWEFLRVTRPQQIVETTLNGNGCHVGIVVFDDALACSPTKFTDIAPAGMEWIAVLPSDKTRDPATANALASGFFFDHHTLPVDRSRLLYCLGHAYGRATLRRTLSKQLAKAEGRFGMIGRSPKMQTLHAQIERIMRASASVLITGESGVGKELAALAIHHGSTRSKGPFVPVNCGALPVNLVESLLFGHERGAFTGAHERHIGSIEAADRGTIFLDEIGDLPLAAQASLLRFLQESTVVRVGSTRSLRIDTRVIAATHTDLEAAVRDGKFREDLFYRLNVLRVQVPPLRERGDDCLLLAEHFLEANHADEAPSVLSFADDVPQAMRRYSWPGNVRELANRVQRAIVMCDGPLIRAFDLQLDQPATTSAVSLANARSGMERNIVESALGRCRNNVAATARELGISRVTLYRLLRRLKISPRADRASLASRSQCGEES